MCISEIQDTSLPANPEMYHISLRHPSRKTSPKATLRSALRRRCDVQPIGQCAAWERSGRSCRRSLSFVRAAGSGAEVRVRAVCWVGARMGVWAARRRAIVWGEGPAGYRDNRPEVLMPFRKPDGTTTSRPPTPPPASSSEIRHRFAARALPGAQGRGGRGSTGRSRMSAARTDRSVPGGKSVERMRL